MIMRMEPLPGNRMFPDEVAFLFVDLERLLPLTLGCVRLVARSQLPPVQVEIVSRDP